MADNHNERSFLLNQQNGAIGPSNVGSNTDNSAARSDTDSTSAVCSRWSLFYFLCFLSGQYINFDRKKKLISVAGLILFLVQFIVFTGYISNAVGIEISRIDENVKYGCSAECGTKCSSDGENLNCATTCFTYSCDWYNKHGCNITDNALPPEHWKLSTAIIIGSIASFLSYISITCWILIPVNCIKCYRLHTNNEDRDGDRNRTNDNNQPNTCNEDTNHGQLNATCRDDIFYTTHKRVLEYGALPLFDDSDDGMSRNETIFFYINYLLIHILLVCSFGFLTWYLVSVYKLYKMEYGINKQNVAKHVLHLISLFCTIQSCFIFSKLVYKVTRKLERLTTEMTNFEELDSPPFHDPEITELLQSGDQEKIDKGRYYWLQELDRKFIKEVEPTLDLFGIWFLIHWFTYALTAMLLAGYILQILMYIAQLKPISVLTYGLIPDPGFACPNDSSEPNIIESYVMNVFSFTLVHAYLFLYPCFRASAITKARSKLIHKISKTRWRTISTSNQSNFVQYLAAQNFALRVPLFCATIPFGFNWVYVSFFLVICGNYLKLT